jgi:hypothetical protein
VSDFSKQYLCDWIPVINAVFTREELQALRTIRPSEFVQKLAELRYDEKSTYRPRLKLDDFEITLEEVFAFKQRAALIISGEKEGQDK